MAGLVREEGVEEPRAKVRPCHLEGRAAVFGEQVWAVAEVREHWRAQRLGDETAGLERHPLFEEHVVDAQERVDLPVVDWRERRVDADRVVCVRLDGVREPVGLRELPAARVNVPLACWQLARVGPVPERRGSRDQVAFHLVDDVGDALRGTPEDGVERGDYGELRLEEVLLRHRDFGEEDRFFGVDGWRADEDLLVRPEQGVLARS